MKNKIQIDKEVPEGWDLLPFGEMAELVKDGYRPTGIDNLAYIGLEHINQQSLSLNSIGHSTQVESNKFFFRSGDILFGKLRPYFRKVYRPRFDGVCSTDIWVVRAQEDNDQGFLFYLMANQDFVDLASSGSSGTRMPRADWDYLKDSLQLKPDCKEQRAIAKILSDIDERIQISYQINKTIRLLVRSLFKRWFIDNEKVLEWQSGKIEDVASLSRDTISPNKFYDESFDHYSIPAFDEGCLPKVEFGSQIQSNKALVPLNAVLLSKLNPRIPRIWFPNVSQGRRSICSTEFLVAVPNPGFSREYIYGVFCSQDFLDKFTALVTGTSGSHQRVKPEYLLEIEVPIPADSFIKKFTDITKPLFVKMLESLAEAHILVQLRDSLLPKLMSGEIRVNSGRLS